jgi:RNA polymerase sigma factor (sigma-70 family)
MTVVRGPVVSESGGPTSTWTDTQLVQGCLDGDERAWAVVVERYQRLIYSIPLKYGASHEEAADVFQSVCLELVTELPRLRRAGALRGWLITVTARQSLRSKNRRVRRNERELTSVDDIEAVPSAKVAAAFAEEIEREQSVRQAVEALPARCRTLVHLLFYEQPPLPYREVAARLGLAVGSIGFIRGRCLKRLERALAEAGW